MGGLLSNTPYLPSCIGVAVGRINSELERFRGGTLNKPQLCLREQVTYTMYLCIVLCAYVRVCM